MSLGRVLYYFFLNFIILFYLLWLVTGSLVSEHVMFCQKEITEDSLWKELGLPGKILFTGILQSVSLISTTIGLFHPWEGSCSIGRELCGAKALRLKWEDTTHTHTQVAPDRGGWRPVPPPSPPSPRHRTSPPTPRGSQAPRAREEKQTVPAPQRYLRVGRSRALHPRALGLHPVPWCQETQCE